MNQKGDGASSSTGFPRKDQSSAERWAPLAWALVVTLVAVEVARRLISGEIPSDLSAYIAAADVFSRGENPYGPALFDSAHYAGFVYVYPPGTLPLIEPLALVPPPIIAAADALLRAAAIVFALSWVRRVLAVELPLAWLVLAAVFYQPLLVDFMAGNLCAYMFAAFIACMWMGHDEPRLWHAFAAVGLGVVLAFKPMWGIPAGLVLLVRGRWKMAAGLVAGAGVVAGLSLVEWTGGFEWTGGQEPTGEVLVDSWLARIESVRARYHSVDLLSLAPSVLPVAVVAWIVAGAVLVRRLGAQHPRLWLWACVSLVAWPRLASYSYLFVVPALCFLWVRWGWRRALALSLVAFGPLPWMLQTFGAEYQHRILLFAWVWIVAAIVFNELRRDAPLSPPVIKETSGEAKKMSGRH
jgi:hypothetical protein